MLKPHYLKKEKHFLEFLLYFSNLHKISHILKKNFSFIAWIVGKLLASKNVVAWMPESSSFRTPFGSQSVHEFQTLLTSATDNFYPHFAVIQHILSQKIVLLVRSKIVGVFGKTLPADDMYSRQNWGKLPQHVKIPLSQKRKTVFRIFIGFLQSTQNFAHFESKGQLYSLNSWEAIDSEKCGCLKAWKLVFQNTLWQSKCGRVPNNAEICLAAPLS